MEKRKGLVSMKGNSLTLLGRELKIGDKAPDFSVLNKDLQPVTNSILNGKTTIILTVPSLDTPVCDMEVRKFNKEAASLSSDVQILVISMDLPFAQSRWCGNAGVDKVMTLSDFNTASFGSNWGVLIKEVRLLARAVFIVDKYGKIAYTQFVRELTNEPDYESVLKAARELVI